MVIHSSIKYFIFFGLAFSGLSLDAAGAKKKPVVKKKAAAKLVAPKPKEMTQTEAHLSVYKKEVDKKYRKELQKFDSLIKECMDNEKTYSNDYYVFYHGQKREFMLFNDFLKELEIFLKKKPLDNFQYVRIPRGFSNKKEANLFLDDADNEFGRWIWNDMFHYSTELLSVNLSLFGNSSQSANAACCSLYYFFDNTNLKIIEINDLILQFSGVYKIHGLNRENLKKGLLNFNSKIQNNEGNLLQIFIPKKIVDKYVYLSRIFGYPYENPLVSEVFSYKKQRHTAIAPIIEQYKLHPSSIHDLDELQARIVITQQGMLNPDSGIKIKRYDTMDPKLKTSYEKEMKTFAAKIIAVWVKEVKDIGKLIKDPYATLTSN